MRRIFRLRRSPTTLLFKYSIFVFLFEIANGIVAYALPIFLSEIISSMTLVGLILASSSIWDIVTDIFLGVSKKNFSFQSLSITASILIIILFASIWISLTPITLILATILWGVYVEFFDFASYKFIGHHTSERNEGRNFGVLQQMKFLGLSISAVIAGATILLGNNQVILTGLFFSFLSLATIYLWFSGKRKFAIIDIEKSINFRRISHFHLIREFKSLFSRGKTILPIIIIFLSFGIIDGALTSFLPIMVYEISTLAKYGGFIVATYTIPSILLPSLFGNIADKSKNKKQLVIIGSLLTSIGATSIGFLENPFLSFLGVTTIGVGLSIFLPVIQAQLETFCVHHLKWEDELLGDSNTMWNIGFILGATFLGILIDVTGNFGYSFGIVGATTFILLIVYALTYKESK